MPDRKKDLVFGAGFGLIVLVVSEVARHLLGHDRSLGEMAWNLWVVPFGALMWRVGKTARRREAGLYPDGTEAGRPDA